MHAISLFVNVFRMLDFDKFIFFIFLNNIFIFDNTIIVRLILVELRIILGLYF